MIYLFTDFGSSDIYVGQMKAVLWQHVSNARVVDLLHDAPNFDAQAGAHLLAALSGRMPPSSVMLAVVDAGVGGARRPLVVQADERWYVGPDNGLLSVIAARSQTVRIWEIVWQPHHLSASFHGRDLFAPIAAMLENHEWWPGALAEVEQLEAVFDAKDLPQVIYIDHYGNAMTGIRAGTLAHSATLQTGNHALHHARVFSEVAAGMPFWYENSIGLVEIAVNSGNAAKQLGLARGDGVRWAN